LIRCFVRNALKLVRLFLYNTTFLFHLHMFDSSYYN
jgi:hypothetical protein